MRLRLAQSRDLRPIQALLRDLAKAGEGDLDGEGELEAERLVRLEAERLVRFDPRRRVVVCAGALLDGAERLVGICALDVDADAPEMVWADDALDESLRPLLIRAARSRVAAIADRAAA